MGLSWAEQYPDDGGSGDDTGEEVRVYGIGVYEPSQGIPLGTYGYWLDPDSPNGLRGPVYAETAEERETWTTYRRLAEEELTQSTAPSSKRDLLRLANPNIKDPKLKDERQRIIGGDISWLGDDWGKSGTIADFRIETEDGKRTLVFELSEEMVFDRNGDYPKEKPEAWRFPVDEIVRCAQSDVLDSLVFEHRSERHGRRDFTIERRNIDPKVLELQEAAMAAKDRIEDWTIFQRLVQAGDFDPRLSGLLVRDFSTSDLASLEVGQADDADTFTIRGSDKEQLLFVSERLFGFLNPKYRLFYPRDSARDLILSGIDQAAQRSITLSYNEDTTDDEAPVSQVSISNLRPGSKWVQGRIKKAIAAAMNPDEVEIDTEPRLGWG